MNQMKKRYMAAFLAVVLFVCSFTTSFSNFNPYATTVKAEDSITVTLHVAQDQSTMVLPTKITLSTTEISDYGIQLPTDKVTPLHALAEYYVITENATKDNMSSYIGGADYGYGFYLESIKGSTGTVANVEDVRSEERRVGKEC